METNTPFLLTLDSWFLLGSTESVTAGFAFSMMLCGLLQLQGSTDLILRSGHLRKALLVAFRPCWTRTNSKVSVFISVSAIWYIPWHHKDLDHLSSSFLWNITLVAAGDLLQFANGCREALVALVRGVDVLQILCMSLILGFSNTANN